MLKFVSIIFNDSNLSQATTAATATSIAPSIHSVQFSFWKVEAEQLRPSIHLSILFSSASASRLFFAWCSVLMGSGCVRADVISSWELCQLSPHFRVVDNALQDKVRSRTGEWAGCSGFELHDPVGDKLIWWWCLLFVLAETKFRSQAPYIPLGRYVP